MDIHVFIFNWRNQFDQTVEKEKALSALGYRVTVINSDEENEQAHWVNLGESAYFTDQFMKALELFDGDVMFHVQGDVAEKKEGHYQAKYVNFKKRNCRAYASRNVHRNYVGSRKELGPAIRPKRKASQRHINKPASG